MPAISDREISNYFIPGANGGLEVGGEFFVHHSKWEGAEGDHVYFEETDLIVFGAIANYLWNHLPDTSGLYFLTGFGLAVIMVDWKECSPTDTSLGYSYASTGSCASDDGANAGSVFNLGFGYASAGGFDVRAEAPLIVLFDSPGNAAGLVPTFTLTAGYRF